MFVKKSSKSSASASAAGSTTPASDTAEGEMQSQYSDSGEESGHENPTEERGVSLTQSASASGSAKQILGSVRTGRFRIGDILNDFDFRTEEGEQDLVDSLMQVVC